MDRRIVAIALVTASCEKSTFTCETDDNCVDGSMVGRCETDEHLCSFPDSDCPNQRHYGPYSGDLSGECVPSNFMFVTNGMITPGTLSANGADPFVTADAICQSAADKANLPGHYIAWLGAHGTSGLDRLEALPVRGWIRPDMLPFADTTTDISQGHFLYPPRIDEMKIDHLPDTPAAIVATGTAANGAVANNADDWTDSTNYQAGRPTVGRVGWTEGSSRTGDAHLYCFGIDHQNAPPIPSATGRIAFVSSAFTPGGGYQAADALCQSDASMARLSGTYLAFISTTMWAAADRFPPMDVPWIRPDHVPLETMNGQLLQGLPATPIALGPDGMPTGQVFRIWTGAPNPGARAVMADNCADWTSATAPSPIVGNNNDTGPGFFHLPSVTTSCAAANVHLYCLQMQ